MNRDHDHTPMRSYLALLGVFHAGLTAVSVERRKQIHHIPFADLFLCGVAAHEASRLLTKDRAQPAAESRKSAARRAVGQLLDCPQCAGPWFSLAWMGLYQLSPSAARVTAGVLAASAISDGLHHLRRLLDSKQRELDSAGDVLEGRAELERMATTLE